MKKDRSNHKKYKSLFFSLKNKLLSFFSENFCSPFSKNQIDVLLTSVEKEYNHDILIELKKEIVTSKEKLKEQKNIFKTFKIKKLMKAENTINAKLNYFKQQQEIDNIEIEINFHNSNNNLDKKATKNEQNYNAINSNETHKNKIIDLSDPDILEFLKYMNLEIYNIEYQLRKDIDYTELEFLEKRILNLNYKRQNFNDNYDFVELAKNFSSKDKYNILTNNSIFEELKEQCNIKIKSKKHLIDSKKQITNDKLCSFDIKSIKKANGILEKQVKNNQSQLLCLQKKLKTKDNTQYNATLLEFVKELLKEKNNDNYNSCIKNDLLNQLIIAFNLNNHVRKIRNLICEEQINFANLDNNIYNDKNCIFNIRLVNEDTITQIEFLKYELISKYSFTDLKNIFNKLYKLEVLTVKQNQMY